jgi:hypothetical protein
LKNKGVDLMAEGVTERLSEELAAEQKPEIPELPFIKKKRDRILFWSVTPTGDYVKDCQMGREYAALALKYMVEADFKPLLTWCLMDMPRKKDCSGIEVGFLEFLAEIAAINFDLKLLGKLSN